MSLNKKTFIINGGLGRILCAIPSLEKYYNTVNTEFYVVVDGFLDLFIGHPFLADKVFSQHHKGLFDLIKDTDITTPEPYHNSNFLNGRKNIVETFDEIINGDNSNTSFYPPTLRFTDQEEADAKNVLVRARNFCKKEKTLVFQPFGSGFTFDHDSRIGFDSSLRSFTLENYLYVSEQLSKYFNLIYLGNIFIEEDDFSIKPDINYKTAINVIKGADYFLGCDSFGQHVSYIFNIPSTVMIGGTFENMISYPDVHSFFKKEGVEKKYSPIRLSFDEIYQAETFNRGLNEFTTDQLDILIGSILDRSSKI